MARNLKKDAIEMAAKKQRILENGFRIFSERTIEKVTMEEVAKAAGIGVATLYRYYKTKSALVLGISIWAWEMYIAENGKKPDVIRETNRTAAEEFELKLEAFLDLYRNHKDLLRFNQFFNIYLQSEAIPEDDKGQYMDMIHELSDQFEKTWQKGQQDGTLKTDMPAKKMFSAALHLMLAAVTRYAVGLAYTEETDAEEELKLQKDMLLRQFVREEALNKNQR